MTKIAVNRLVGQVWYDRFSDIVEDLSTDLWAYMGDIVLFNVRYRDVLREKGRDGLFKALFEEAPAFRRDTEAIRHLEGALDRWGPVADYDIQCLSVRDTFEVLGQTFQGLDDVKGRIDWFMRGEREAHPSRRRESRSAPIQILDNYEPYPIFDSSDWGDDRDYCNFFFQKRPFSAADFQEIAGINAKSNFCKAHDNLPHVEERPLLYYTGDGETMLLVTPKEAIGISPAEKRLTH